MGGGHLGFCAIVKKEWEIHVSSNNGSFYYVILEHCQMCLNVNHEWPSLYCHISAETSHIDFLDSYLENEDGITEDNIPVCVERNTQNQLNSTLQEETGALNMQYGLVPLTDFSTIQGIYIVHGPELVTAPQLLTHTNFFKLWYVHNMKWDINSKK